MLADAPVEVDARYRADADLDLCVVLAGGGDFRKGLTAADVYQSLRTYCRERRAAGFRVVVLSVLPVQRAGDVRGHPPRLQRHAPGHLAPVRRRPGRHRLRPPHRRCRRQPRPAVLPARRAASQQRRLRRHGRASRRRSSASSPGSPSRCEVRLREADGEWGDWRPYAAATTLELPEGEGPRLVQAEYRLDGGAPVTVADDDLRRHRSARRRSLCGTSSRAAARRCGCRFRVDDAQPCGPTCTATVQVTTSGGRVLRTFVRRLVPVGRADVRHVRRPAAAARTGTSSRRATPPATRRASPGSARLTVR